MVVNTRVPRDVFVFTFFFLFEILWKHTTAKSS